MILTINGVNMKPYLANQGVSYTRNDIDGPNAGRALDGTMYRDRVTVKDKWTITCRPLTAEECAIVMQAIYPEYVTVTVTDPRTNSTRTFTAYSNNVPAQYLMRKKKNGKWIDYWTGVSFPLIER